MGSRLFQLIPLQNLFPSNFLKGGLFPWISIWPFAIRGIYTFAVLNHLLLFNFREISPTKFRIHFFSCRL